MILATYGMKYITMEADCQAYILAKERTSVPMCMQMEYFWSAAVAFVKALIKRWCPKCEIPSQNPIEESQELAKNKACSSTTYSTLFSVAP